MGDSGGTDMKIYLFEDDINTIDYMVEKAVNRSFNQSNIIIATSLEEALGLISIIKNDDIVSLDSQIPDAGDGVKIAEAIRETDIKCLIVWHSKAKIPDFERLAIYPYSLGDGWINSVMSYKADWDIKRNIYKYYKRKSDPSLVVLSILCQGYLASHGGQGLKSWGNIKDEKYKQDSLSRKELTESIEKWWNTIKESSSIEQEMYHLGLDLQLVTKIKSSSCPPLNSETDVYLVKEAYSVLSKPENLGRFL